MSEFDPNATQDHLPDQPLRDDGSLAELPQWIGRYRVKKIIGQGAFGLVYLAQDESLDRPVAVKVPHARLVSRVEDAKLYLAEARTVANLEHPNIVPVHDFGSTAEFPCFMVSRYVPGSDLATHLKQARFSYAKTADLVATIAEALHYAHKRGIVHRDVKPGNILIDKHGKPFIVDFGVALREDSLGKGARHVGTPAYMSPEQARKEGHRVDGRSDIFSLGVLFYEMLAGRRPFRANTEDEILDQIQTLEPRPLSQYDERIPEELQRICLKALSKRASDRFSSAHKMAEDLLHFLNSPESLSAASNPKQISSTAETADPATPTQADSAKSAKPVSEPDQPISDSQIIKIVPKGLRSFDAHDADFFLELLPGARDRNGLPDSLRFWKTRIDETDPDNTFSVGLIYGPSGCGKSSLVKAGLLPRLSPDVIAIYLEATSDETELRLLSGLRKRCPLLEEQWSLAESLAALRRGQSLAPGKKVLIVIDQFEQWLHAKRDQEHTELVAAIRQCDGIHVQCIVMVRDDFWMAATRFMRDLDIRLVEGQNSAAVDLFPIRHAEKVLAAFGRAFGALSGETKSLTKEQTTFLSQAVAGLAEEGKVVCVRLALFAEMFKGKPWTSAALIEVGGTTGVGVTFLEETFSAKTAPPEHRYHQAAARAVLKELLPGSGTDIKGHMRSREELLAASGYADRPREFEDLLRILDSEIRLITPTDLTGLSDGTESVRDTTQRYFQLTHDYLVPSLRDWLTRKQRETKKGRAELRLAELSGVWSQKPESRYLPSFLETTQIRRLTERSKWTSAESSMMAAATRKYLLRGLGIVGLSGMLIFAGFMAIRQVVAWREQDRANGLVASLATANTVDVPQIVKQLQPSLASVAEQLRGLVADPQSTSNAKVHASLALVDTDPAQVDFLKTELPRASSEKIDVLRTALKPFADKCSRDYWQALGDSNSDAPQVLPMAAALALWSPADPQWKERKLVDRIVDRLVSENPLRLATWIELLQPVALNLNPSLADVLRNERKSYSESQIDLATNILANFAAKDFKTIAELMPLATPKQFVALFDLFAADSASANAVIDTGLAQTLAPVWNDPALAASWTPVSTETFAAIDAAGGLMEERFAFCVSMPLEQFVAVAESLRPSGYRPIRFRPFDNGGVIQVAAAWTRDGRDWKLELDQRHSALLKLDAEHRAAGFVAVDVAGYLENRAGTERDSRYGGLWVQRQKESEDSRVYLGIPSQRHNATTDALGNQGFKLQQTLQQHRTANGEILLSGTRSNAESEGYESGWLKSLGELEPLRQLTTDVDVSPPAKATDLALDYRKLVEQSSIALQENPDDLSSLQIRGMAQVMLGEDSAGLADLDRVLGGTPPDNRANWSESFRHRALAHARLNQAEKALADLAEFDKVNQDRSLALYMAAIIDAHLAQDTGGIAALEKIATSILEPPTNPAANERWNGEAIYNFACAFGICAAVEQKRQGEQARHFEARAAAMLQAAVDAGYNNLTHARTDVDLASIRQHPAYIKLMVADLAERYAVVRLDMGGFESRLLTGLSSAEHQQKSREQLADGFRLVAIAADKPDPQSGVDQTKPVVASVWHRPVVSEMEKERLADQQANLAVAALRLKNLEKVWSLLRHSTDPRLRTKIIHLLSDCQVSPVPLIERLANEPDVSTRRAIILALGELSSGLDAGTRTTLAASLLRLYRDDPDAGIHGALRWVLLNHLDQAAEISKIDTELATGKPEGQRAWYVTSRQGHTMTVVDGPVEFMMGGTVDSDPDHFSTEDLHRVRINRRFAIATTETTVAQFQEFLKQNPDSQFSYEKRVSPDPNCPINAPSWYQAAMYCNWLSEQAGIPRNQWCYPNISAIKDGMKLPENYLQRTGFRLPTEAEWEYACRAGAATPFYYGSSKLALGKYAWFLENANQRSWPIGLLKPNDLGLFDMHGNLWEWTQDEYQDYDTTLIDDAERNLVVNNGAGRVSRGGSWNDPASSCRTASRSGYQPTFRGTGMGFRVAQVLELQPRLGAEPSSSGKRSEE